MTKALLTVMSLIAAAAICYVLFTQYGAPMFERNNPVHVQNDDTGELCDPAEVMFDEIAAKVNETSGTDMFNTDNGEC